MFAFNIFVMISKPEKTKNNKKKKQRKTNKKTKTKKTLLKKEAFRTHNDASLICNGMPLTLKSGEKNQIVIIWFNFLFFRLDIKQQQATLNTVA